jgi:hypothetical protein
MIQNDEIPGTGMEPVGVYHGTTITQGDLDEAARALGRPLWDFETRILDEILTAQKMVNARWLKEMRIERIHSLDEVIHIFVERVKKAQNATRKVMVTKR